MFRPQRKQKKGRKVWGSSKWAVLWEWAQSVCVFIMFLLMFARDHPTQGRC